MLSGAQGLNIVSCGALSIPPNSRKPGFKVGSPRVNSATPSNAVFRKSLYVPYLNNDVELSAQTLPTRNTHEYFDS